MVKLNVQVGRLVKRCAELVVGGSLKYKNLGNEGRETLSAMSKVSVTVGKESGQRSSDV
jgi:hypothetical protein